MKTFSTVLARATTAATLLINLSQVDAQVAMQQHQSAAGELTVLYPTQEPANSPPGAFGAFDVQVAIHGKPSKLNGRLIVMSHGLGGSPLPDFDLAKRLVSEGFVVAHIIHQGDNWRDGKDAGPVSFARRPAEASAAIDRLMQLPEFASQLDFKRVGLHGMSAGGVTALSHAGARWSLAHMAQHCLDQAKEDENFCFVGARSEQAKNDRMAQWRSVLQRDGASQSLPSTKADDRISAITTIVPVAAIFTAESLSQISKPVGVVTALSDEWLRPVFHSDYVLKHCKACVSLASLPNASHFDVLSPWPTSVAKGIEASYNGAALNPKFNPQDRQLAYQSIAQFFLRQLF